MATAKGKGGYHKREALAKMCIKCGRVLPLTHFYSNREWVGQNYRDAWCRECANKYCVDKDTLQQYCYENNRVWDDALWESAMKKAQYSLANNKTYIDPKTSFERKQQVENKTCVRQFFSMMNMVNNYRYIDNIDKKGIYIEEKEAEKESARLGDEGLEDAQMIYSPKWRGTYSKAEIAAMETAYDRYVKDFPIDTVAAEDYTIKTIKASMNADIAADRYKRGEIPLAEYKAAMQVYDDLSKSQNFAASSRKAGDTTGLGTLGEIIYRLELEGALNERKVTFPPDDVDKIIADFRHTDIAIGDAEEVME